MDGVNESILTTVKKLIGIPEDVESFDADLIVDINASFMILTQIGAGPPMGFTIHDKTALWTDFMPDSGLLEMVKSYVHLKAKKLFDTRDVSSYIGPFNEMIDELESRISYAVDPPPEE